MPRPKDQVSGLRVDLSPEPETLHLIPAFPLAQVGYSGDRQDCGIMACSDSRFTRERGVLLQITDFNGADEVIRRSFEAPWEEVKAVLEAMPLHLKASDQAGIQGRPIFDPVGTNEHVKRELVALGWQAGIPIPDEYSFLGTDIDFGKQGLVVEVQFSNYPFLLNNTIRSELFFKAGISLAGHRSGAAVVVTKAGMFPASNSTLYYEQAVKQLTALAKNKVFDAPIRLVGLFEVTGTGITVCFTTYRGRYSRVVAERQNRICLIDPGARTRSRLQLRNS